jgi:hypothetical protein
MGASGIIGSLVDQTSKPLMGENILFIIGVIGAPLFVIGQPGLGATNITGNWLVTIAGALLVGVGTRLANGCTSGHARWNVVQSKAKVATSTLGPQGRVKSSYMTSWCLGKYQGLSCYLGWAGINQPLFITLWDKKCALTYNIPSLRLKSL